MFFYKIEVGFDCDNSIDGVAFETTILVHDVKMSNDEFREICRQEKELIIESQGDITLYDMVLGLTTKHGFKNIELTSSWDC